MGLRRYLYRTYFSIDPRSLGLFRVLFACALLLDLYLRYRDVDVWYTNDGLLPNHTLLWAPPAPRMFSFFFMASTHAEAVAAMAACALVFLGLLVGYRTKWMQCLSLLCVVSLNTRMCLLENGGDIALNHLAIWTVFLPLGRRFSLDALLHSMRTREEHSATDLLDRSQLHAPDAPVFSVAVFGVISQLFVIYLFNALSKNEGAWLDGNAVQLTLHQDRMVTGLGVFLREHAPFGVLRALTYATLAIELLGAALVIAPVFVVTTRLLAIAILPLLHLGFALLLDLGAFSFVMIAFYPLLLHERHWAALERFAARRGPRLTCFFDADCGFCFLVVRVLARLDPHARVRFVPNHELAQLPSGIDAALVERTVVVKNEGSGRVSTRSDAIAEVFRAVPLGFIAYVVLRVPGLRAVWLRLYSLVADNRIRVSVFLGLGACGVPQAYGAPASALPIESGLQACKAQSVRALREVLAAVVLLAAVGETLTYNAPVPAWLHYPQPAVLQALIDYGRLIQSWRMFAPDVPDHDLMISVEAITKDGRMVDPYNEVASRYHRAPFTHIPARLGNDQFFNTYSLIMPEERSSPYWGALEDWILAYPRRTGRAQDAIERFSVYVLGDQSPRLGSRVPRAFQKQAFLTYPRP